MTSHNRRRDRVARDRRPIASASVLAIVFLMTLSSPASGQSIVRGDLDGVVRAMDGGDPLFGVAVTVTDAGTGTSMPLETDRQGRFGASMLQAGEYEVLAEAPGFMPKLVRGVQLRGGQSALVSVELESAPPPISSVDTVFAAGSANPLFDALGSRWVSGGEIRAFPEPRMGLDGLGALGPAMDGYLGSEGLPGTATTIYWDGLPFTPARQPLQASAGTLPILPRIGLANVDVHNRTDVEWSGAGARVAAISRAPSGRTDGEAYAAATAAALWQSKSFSGETVPGMTSGWGGATVDVPLGTSTLFAGVEGLYLQTPQASPFSTDLAERLTNVEPPAEGLQATDLSAPWLSTTQAVSGLARLDWNGSPSTDVTARAGFSTLATKGSDLFSESLAYGSTPPLDGTDASAAVTVLSRFSPTVTLELRAGLNYSSREWSGTAGGTEASVVPSTLFTGSQTQLGPPPALPGKVSRTEFVGSPVVHFRLSERQSLKAGVTFSIPSYDYRYVENSGGSFLFGTPEDVGSGEGYFEIVGPSASRTFTVPKLGVFLQHQWDPNPRVSITTGLRYEQEQLPRSKVPFSVPLDSLAGLNNTTFDAPLKNVSPRIGLALDLSGDGRTLIEGTVSASYDEFDAGAFNDVISLTEPVSRQWQIGGLSQWPQAPASGGGSGQVLAVLGPKLKAPRTARASLGLTQALGARSTLHLIGTIRRTEFLLRRSDINLATSPVSSLEQDGRSIYGNLQEVGSLVVADPLSNRRFSDFDLIWGYGADGWSTYRGATIAFEHTATDRLELFASYTYSSTRDNLVGASSSDPFAQLSPHVDANASSPWETGTSDFDVPHRITAGVRTHADVLEGLEASALYRFRSGWAYTPGFRAGTDVNGDGSGSNDPAFVPSDVASAGLADTSCLNEDIGRIATRNACRGPGLSFLDAHLSLGLFRIGGSTGHLTLDLFNALDTDIGRPDAALLLIDETQGITQGASTTSIPTAINPTFGETTHSLRSGRMLRIGFRIGRP